MTAKDRDRCGRLSTVHQWDDYFEQGNWETNHGRLQTRLFAKAFCQRTRLDQNACRSLVDSSCALGDALPLIREHFPNSQLYGCDISSKAIERCRKTFPDLASFSVASIEELTGQYDVILSSATLEHFTDYQDKARALLHHCKYLCVIVPYNETRFGRDLEFDADYDHVVTFRERSFDFLLDEGLARRIHRPRIFCVPGAWSRTKKDWIIQLPGNVLRLLLRRPIARNRKMILFEIEKAD